MSENKYFTLVIDSNDFNHKVETYETSYGTALALIEEFKLNGIEANITVGGVSVFFQEFQKEVVMQVFKKWDIVPKQDKYTSLQLRIIQRDNWID